MQRRDRAVLLTALWICFGLTFWPWAAHAKAATGLVTVPMQVELDRPYIDVTLTGPNGYRVKAHAYVDTGGGALIFSAGLAKKLGLKANGKALHEEGQTLTPTATPAMDIGGKRVELVDAHALIDAGETRTLGRTDAEMMLPGRFLLRYVVAFDYPARAFTLADPGAFKPDGTPVKAAISGGMPVVRASVAGKSYGFLLDTGGQYCMISDAELGPWHKQHPDWPRADGVYGPANMQIGQFETKLYMLRIGALQWGPFRIEGAGAVSRPIGSYENMMSETVGMPVIGSIGGNVLRHFKVTVDYPAQTVYLDGSTTVRDGSIDMVGIMLEPATHGGYKVVGTVSGVRDIRIGDELLEVDGHDVTRAPFSTVANLLGGSPGTSRTLLLQRGPTRLTVHAKVQSVF